MSKKTDNLVYELLVNNRRCKICNMPVLRSLLPQYKYQCLHCDEDLFEFETVKSPEGCTESEKAKLLELAETEFS